MFVAHASAQKHKEANSEETKENQPDFISDEDKKAEQKLSGFAEEI
jgi:hypothetical protein